MIQPKVEIQVQIEVLVGICDGLNRGDTLTHEMVYQAVPDRFRGSRYRHVVDSVRRRLRETRGLVLWSVYNVGYKLVTPDEQVIYVTQKCRDKQVTQDLRIISYNRCIPTGELSDHLNTVRAGNIAAAMARRKVARNESRAEESLSRVATNLPRCRYQPKQRKVPSFA